MGTYTELYIADYPTYSTKGYVDPTVMTIFRERDKKVYQRQFSERNRFTWGHITEDEIEIAYEYSATVSVVRDRLDLMGFSLERTKQEFGNGLQNAIEDIKDRIIRLQDTSSGLAALRVHDLQTQHLLETSIFEDWLSAFAYIINCQLPRWASDSKSLLTEPPLVQYILGRDDFGPVYHFPCDDIRFFLRVFTEVCPGDSLVTQDITDLINAGYYSPDDYVCDISRGELTQDYPVNEKIIILTEGSTDVHILEESLALLYPHLYDYYSFMDFGVSNAAGGASFLVSTIKAFIGSGIRNRIIAIFDNDTAALASRKTLFRIAVPDNIKILNYPDLELAKYYPTIGPNGVSKLNINGLACSIELYLGTDVLFYNDSLTPIHWKGYEAGLNQYQGEILNKKELQDRFYEKVANCKRESRLVEQYDWEGMRILFNKIFRAFA